jgi:hypothetical protein
VTPHPDLALCPLSELTTERQLLEREEELFELWQAGQISDDEYVRRWRQVDARLRRFATGGCWDVLNFFESAATAERYLELHPEVGGSPIAIPIALAASRAIFAEVFKDA